jgi:3-deoxy-7-phosphoheptulonate synthase
MIYHFSPSDSQVEQFLKMLQNTGLDYDLIRHDRIVVHVLGNVNANQKQKLDEIYDSVTSSIYTNSNIKKEFHDNSYPTIIAGPCAIESEEQIATITASISEMGVKYLRGGAFKPRTTSDSFQGMGKEGLIIAAKYAKKYGLKVVTEVMDRSQIELVKEYADIMQIGSRNMFNYTLLVALGSVDKPILLKRGMMATIEEWIMAADYIRKGGNEAIILCERGIRTFEPMTRNTLDLATIHLIKTKTDYPIVVDPSHAAGRSDLVPSLTLAAVAAGANGILIETHHNPKQALSDKDQALTLSELKKLLQKIRNLLS